MKKLVTVIKNNDYYRKNIEKIITFKSDDIKKISTKLKEKKLSNIYSGRKLSLILQKIRGHGSNTVINLIYPVNNTSSIEIRKCSK